jgi:hypothetical protein
LTRNLRRRVSISRRRRAAALQGRRNRAFDRDATRPRCWRGARPRKRSKGGRVVKCANGAQHECNYYSKCWKQFFRRYEWSWRLDSVSAPHASKASAMPSIVDELREDRLGTAIWLSRENARRSKFMSSRPMVDDLRLVRCFEKEALLIRVRQCGSR